MRHRPTEIKEIVKLLEREHEDIDQLAVDILDLLVDIKWRRGAFVVAVQQFGHLFLFGPFANRQEAKRSIGKDIVAADTGARGGAILVEDITVLRERIGMPVEEEDVLF